MFRQISGVCDSELERRGLVPFFFLNGRFAGPSVDVCFLNPVRVEPILCAAESSSPLSAPFPRSHALVSSFAIMRSPPPGAATAGRFVSIVPGVQSSPLTTPRDGGVRVGFPQPLRRYPRPTIPSFFDKVFGLHGRDPLPRWSDADGNALTCVMRHVPTRPDFFFSFF